MSRKGDARVVSDLSRFEFETPSPRIRSRNSSIDEQPEVIDLGHSGFRSHTDLPPSFFEDNVPVPDPGPPPQRQKTLLEIAEANNALPRKDPNATMNSASFDYDDIYQYYEKPSTSSLVDEHRNPKEFVPYPSSIRNDHETPVQSLPYNTKNSVEIPSIPPDDLTTVKTPMTNATSIMPSTPMTKFTNMTNYRDKDLPPIMQPSEFYKQKNPNDSESLYKGSTLSLTSKQKEMEKHLVKSVMNRPLLSFPAEQILRDEMYEGQQITITANFVLYFFEMIISIIIIALSSVLEKEDGRIDSGIYRYFIADGTISLIISLLFMTTLVSFEKRNGSFYCTAAMVISLVSFILSISVIIPNKDCPSASICRLRKANSAFVIVSAFLWLIDLTMFLTTLYISRMNLLDDLNFDYSNRGLTKGFNASISSESLSYNNEKSNELIDPTSGQPLKEYYLNESGEMFELTNDFDVRGKHKIIVYTI